jgi:hypothetical protein
VAVQDAPWLVDRALSQFAPVYFGLKPVPYFADGDDGSIRLRPPVFSTAAFRVDGSVYRKHRPTRKQFFSFAAKIGAPLLVHDDWSRLAYRCQSMTGLVDRPTRRGGEALKHVYGRIQALCAEHHSSLIVVVLGSGARPVPIPSELAGLDLCVVDAHSALIGRLDAPSAFETTYETFRRGRDVYREGHPNPQAHSIIAEILASRIAEMRAGRTGSR